MNNRRKLLLGNWKMNKTGKEVIAYGNELKQLLKDVKLDIDFGVAPTSLHLHLLNSVLHQQTNVIVAAQNAYWKDYGAYTGEISFAQLKADGFSYVLVGHSERRVLFGETNEIVNAKTLAALNNGLKVVFCFGETLEEYESKQTFDVLKKQLELGLANLPLEHAKNLILAYEPVWAIGTGKTATSQTAQDTISYVRHGVLTNLLSAELANEIQILYGGSVNLSNIEELINQPDIDGALVGGASLVAKDFFEMAKKIK